MFLCNLILFLFTLPIVGQFFFPLTFLGEPLGCI